MKTHIQSSEENYQLYRNNRNENKYIEVKKSSDGHTWYRSFMFWNTDRGPVKNYYTSKSNKGRWHRGTQESVKKMLEDYKMVESIQDGIKDDFIYEGSPENPNDVISSSRKIFIKGSGKVFASCIGNYRGYEICQENDHDQRFYFLDDKRNIHFADLEDELKAQIDKYVETSKQEITSAEKDVQPFLVTFAYDDNGEDMEGEDIVYAVDEESACKQWEEYCDTDFIENYIGCDARLATPEEVDRIKAEKQSYGVIPPDDITSSTDINRKPINEDLLNFLEDLQYTQGVMLDTDCSFLVLSDEEEKRLERWMSKYMIAADDGRENACKEIARIVEEYVENLPVSVDSAIEASEDGKTPWKIHYGYDVGDAESGPIIRSGWDIYYADSAESAEYGWENEFASTSSGYEGCWVEPATQADVDEWNRIMKELDEPPFE